MSATPIGFFGLKLVPGKVHRMDVSRDFKITNVSYADQPKSNTKTLVKIHYTHVPGFEDDYDEEEQEKEPKSTDEEEEIEEKVYTLCSLNGANKDHAVVDLQFCQEELIGFSITGDAPVDLVGNYVAPPDFFDQDPSDSELYSDDEDDDEDMYGLDSDDFDDDDDDDMDEDPDRFEELVESSASKPKKAIEAAPLSDSKKRAAEKPVKETAAKKLKADASAASAASTPTKAIETKGEKQTKGAKDTKPKSETVEKKTVDKSTSKMTTTKLPSGLVIEEKSAGSGPPCKAGQKVGMRYVGKLTNGKVFDQCTSGKPFYFKLGKGEVIKGWDEGVKGMRVGAERRLTCPPKLAYGNQKIPGIPANSTLVFDVKLVEIK